VRRALERIEIPGEPEARGRAWHIAAAAFAERQPVPHRNRRKLAPAIAIVAAGAAAAAAFSSPGQALLHSIRQSVGVQGAQPALFWVVTPGRLLVHSDGGAWVVQSDGARRRLGAYTSASWSPHGMYVAATGKNELVTLTPSGTLRWSLARRNVRTPRWTGTTTDTRIAYTTRDELRVVGGDGHGDTGLGRAPDLGGAPLAWRPGARRVLAYALPMQRILRVIDVDAKGEEIWSRTIPAGVSRLEWSTDGSRLLVFAPIGLRVYDARGHVVAQDDPSDATHDADATFLPGSGKVAVVRVHGAQSDIFLLDSGRSLFHVAGRLGQLVASPNGSWLIVAWPDADQLVFVPVRGGRVRAVANISAQFRSQSFPRIDGWCCAP
jgi:hypothetical protein